MEKLFDLAAWAVVAEPKVLASGKTSYDDIPEENLPLDIYANEGNVVICAGASVVGRLERGRTIARINCGSKFRKNYKSQDEALKDPEYLRHLKHQRELALAVLKELGDERLLAIAIGNEKKKSGTTPKVYDPNLVVSSLAVAIDYFERIRELNGLPVKAEPAKAATDTVAKADADTVAKADAVTTPATM